MAEKTVEKILISGNEAAGVGALHAGCKYFFAYPITPQNELAEFMSRELPKIGGVYLQGEGETGVANMLLGGALTGERVMTATASPGFSLMHEAISHMHILELPIVLVEVTRLGPGSGTGGQQGQTDYNQVTKGGGHGGYHSIVIAPYSVQEIFDYTQLAFYLADKYRNMVILLSDFILCRGSEPIVPKVLEFPPLPKKDWGLMGKAKKGGRADHPMTGFVWNDNVVDFFLRQREKYRQIAEAETRFDSYKTEDAEFLLVAYGSTARAAKRAVSIAREQGLKVGLLRPITLWPFPEEAVRKAAWQAGKVLVVEDSPGEMVEDVKAAVQGKVPVHLLGVWGRDNTGPGGLIFPERIFEEVKDLIWKKS